MNNFLEFYQQLPYRINPEIFHIGQYSFGWYAFMYLMGFFVIYLLLHKRLILGESEMSVDQLLDILIFCFIGAIIGGRLGYVLFYNLSYYLANPLAIISPFNLSDGKLIGIRGMSYHGGLVGALVCGFIFVKKNKLDFWQITDFILPAIPAGYFFGRIGNFLNNELYGRITDKWWGMYFPGDTLHALRYPSQLYEAFLEGFLLFAFFWTIRNSVEFRGKILAWYLMGYAIMRFSGEFFRQPDAQIGLLISGLSMGQILSLVMFFCGAMILFWRKRKNVV
jgi:phosphatidylglycerol:prolipoprotein diacylglycerol transferase